MRQTEGNHQTGPATFAGISSRKFFATLIMLMAATAVRAGAVLEPSALGHLVGASLKPGSIIYADSGDGIRGGAIIMIDAATHQRTIISSGGYLRNPLHPVIDANGCIVVSDSGRLIRVCPETGCQTILADSSSILGYPCGLSVDRRGDIICANLAGVVAIDPVTGEVRNIPGCSNLPNAIGVTVAENGDLIVVMRATPGTPARIVRVNPHNAKQELITEGIYLSTPQSICVHGHDCYVTDIATPDGNFGVGRVIHVDARTGNQAVTSQGLNLLQPVGIAVDINGQLITSDPYTVNPDRSDRNDGGYDGAVISIDPVTGVQTVLSRGDGSFVNPLGLVIVPTRVSLDESALRSPVLR